MLRVGLTGGLASGKSFVGHQLESLGCLLIQADALGHQVLRPDGEAYPGVVKEFGSEVLNEDGTINRRRLAKQVFGNPERLAILNGLVHPPVFRREQDLIDRYQAENPTGIAVVEAAILIETGSYKRYDRVILAVCSEAQQIERAMRRDGATREDVEARLRNQMPLAEKAKFAHYVIDTSGTKEETAGQVERVYHHLRSLLQ